MHPRQVEFTLSLMGFSGSDVVRTGARDASPYWGEPPAKCLGAVWGPIRCNGKSQG